VLKEGKNYPETDAPLAIKYSLKRESDGDVIDANLLHKVKPLECILHGYIYLMFRRYVEDVLLGLQLFEDWRRDYTKEYFQVRIRCMNSYNDFSSFRNVASLLWLVLMNLF
jgi:hypothetical protein